MKTIFLKLVRYRGAWLVLGRNQAMRMLLDKADYLCL